MDLIISILPFIAIMLIWIFIMFRLKKKMKPTEFINKQDEILSLLKELKQEVEKLNKNNLSKNN